MVAIIPSSAFAAALAAMVAQNIGANKPERAKKCLLISVGFGLTVSVAIFVLMQLATASIVSIFSQDSDIIDAACD